MNYLISYLLFIWHCILHFTLSKQDMHVVENQTEGLIMKSLLLHHSNPLVRSLRSSLLNMFVSHSFELSQQSLHLLTSACCSSMFVVLQLLDNVYWLSTDRRGFISSLSPYFTPFSSPTHVLLLFTLLLGTSAILNCLLNFHFLDQLLRVSLDLYSKRSRYWYTSLVSISSTLTPSLMSYIFVQVDNLYIISCNTK